MSVLRGFPAQGVVAVFDEAPGGGAIGNFDAPRNAPAKDPGQHTDRVYWHSAFFQYQLAMPIQTVTVDHPALSGRQTFWGPSPWFNRQDSQVYSGLAYAVPGRTQAAEHTLVTHDLGFVPLAFVAWDDRMVMPGVAVQTASGGRNRFVAPFSTSSIVGLREVFNASNNSLAAVSRTYQVLVFNVPEADAELPLFGRVGETIVLGRGKVDTSHYYLRQLGSGDSPFAIDIGRTVDIDNGRARIVTAGETVTEDGYGGSFAGSPFVSVGL
ncbi:hypothetical protein [Pelagibacterium montanilacus]|uniref:hypothetical protein n=1 Tax=Pelagibacterium montanilacus TaxID=2185280 RepID=UPI000F8ECAD6|nr:hypothetical protein [Pelagibacterium montanilacus]